MIIRSSSFAFLSIDFNQSLIYLILNKFYRKRIMLFHINRKQNILQEKGSTFIRGFMQIPKSLPNGECIIPSLNLKKHLIYDKEFNEHDGLSILHIIFFLGIFINSLDFLSKNQLGFPFPKSTCPNTCTQT
jgi:hypothetical protein